MTFEQKIVLDLLGQTLFDVPFAPDYCKQEDICWEDIFAEAFKQTVIPTVIPSIPADVDRELVRSWSSYASVAEQQGQRIFSAHVSVSELLKQNNIPFVIIKGASTGSYYPKSNLRNYGDVDLLVYPSNFDELKEALLENGYQIGKELPFELSMTKDDIEFDVHQEINGTPAGSCGDYIRQEMSNIIETSGQYQINGTEIPVPDDFHHGMIQLLHTAKHMVGFGAGLRQLCDWAVFANKIGNAFPEMFEEKLRKSGLWKLASVMSGACVKYLHMESFEWIAASEPDSDLIDRFMDDLMRKGNIAHDGNDDMDSVFIEETNKGGVSHNNMFSQMLSNISGKVCYQWPIMKKYKFLIPFGFVWMCIRYVYGICIGTYKKTNLKATIEKANKRKALYEELKLFTE